jgi:hypothetical protein
MPKLKTHRGAAKRFQKDRDRKSKTVEGVLASYPDVEGQEAQVAFERNGTGK